MNEIEIEQLTDGEPVEIRPINATHQHEDYCSMSKDTDLYGRFHMHPASFTEHPISESDAREVCRTRVGLGIREIDTYRLFKECRDAWWNHLRAAKTPEERLSCERMINNINIAFGLHLHDQGETLAKQNRERRAREEAEQARAKAEAAETAAIDRWCSFRSQP